MIALRVLSLKNFMSSILTGDAFDIFLLEQADVTGACTYSIDGHINKDFFTAEERGDKEVCPYDFAAWKDMKATLYQFIKGKHTPLQFKFVLHLMPGHTVSILREDAPESLSQVKALVLTVKYEAGQAQLFTGTSFHTFVLDKEPDRLWDAALLRYLEKKGIGCELQ